MSRERDKKKEMLEKEFFNKFCALEILNAEEAPIGMANTFKKLYKKMLVELSHKRIHENDSLVYECLKSLRSIYFDFDNKNHHAMKLFEKPVMQKIYAGIKDKLEFNKIKFLKATLQLVVACISDYLIKNSNFNNYFPEKLFALGFLNNKVYVKFITIKMEKTEHGRIYKHNKTIELNGKKYDLYFTKHALERIAERILKDRPETISRMFLGNKLTYDIANDILSKFITHSNFSFTENNNLLCNYMPLTYDFDRKVIKNKMFMSSFDLKLLEGQKYVTILMKYFYFPFNIVGDKIICKSALIAGYDGTPEFKLKREIVSDKINHEKICSKDAWESFKDIIKNFYDKYDNNSCVFDDNFPLIVMIYHILGSEQFFKGEWREFPIHCNTTSDIN